jgi:CobQ-like glutamine amidotransferase family enzyme
VTPLRIAHLYPELLNLYGDRGNVIVLRRRLEWAGIPVVVEEVPLGAEGHLPEADLIFIGGGQDREQQVLGEDLRRVKKRGLQEALASGSVVLAVCGGYQLLGRYYRTRTGVEIPGLELVDLVTDPGPDRLIGNIVLRVEALGGRTVVGFENHGGRTVLGPGVPPFGRVLKGHGNNGRDGTEGVWQGNLIGTYVHGALLPKNPHLADALLEVALRRSGELHRWKPPPADVEEWAHARVLMRLGVR